MAMKWFVCHVASFSKRYYAYAQWHHTKNKQTKISSIPDDHFRRMRSICVLSLTTGKIIKQNCRFFRINCFGAFEEIDDTTNSQCNACTVLLLCASLRLLNWAVEMPKELNFMSCHVSTLIYFWHTEPNRDMLELSYEMSEFHVSRSEFGCAFKKQIKFNRVPDIWPINHRISLS